MKKEIVEILQCPICEGSLSFNSMLNCNKCMANFPVVNDIALLLTSKELHKFLKEPWGKELLEEDFGKFVSSNDAISKLQKIVKQAKLESLERNKKVDNSGFVFPEDLDLAIKKSREILAKKVRAKTAHTILDWPTGPGFFLEHLIDIAPKDALIVATDINLGQLATTKAYLERTKKKRNLVFVVCDARKMPFKDETFQAVTAWGGSSEIPSSGLAVKESYRLLEKGGYFGISGDVYREKSRSFRIAEKLNLDSLITKKRIENNLKGVGFESLSYDIVFEGEDTDLETLAKERCPLPAKGDWFSVMVAGGKKPNKRKG